MATMPILKPRRDPTHTAEWIEALFFPTIIDRIFHFAPHSSLLAFRATCRSWKDLGERHMVHRIAISHSRGSRVTSSTTTTASGHSIPRQKWLQTKLVREIRHLDVLHWYIPAWIKKTGTISSVRYRPTSASAVVAFYPTAPVTGWWNRSLVWANHIDLEEMGRPKHLTIAIGDKCEAFLTLNGLPESLTIVVCDVHSMPGYYFTLNRLRDFILNILLEGTGNPPLPAAITLVNFSALPSDHLNLNYAGSSLDTEAKAKELRLLLGEAEYRKTAKTLIHEQLVETIRGRLHERGTVPEHAVELLSAIRSISMEEWSREVGEDEVRWATELAC